MPKISAVIIARNEEKRITDCLKSVSFCDERIVVDSDSSDQTVEIARQEGASVYNRPFSDFASQKNFGIGKAHGEWILSVDADERVSDELKSEILRILESPQAKGYRIRRINYIFKKEMKYGGHQYDYPLRLFKEGCGFFEGMIHESVRCESPIRTLEAPLIHLSTETISDYLRKLHLYTELETSHLLEKGPDHLLFKALVYPPMRFFQRYVIQLGFLDGFKGFIFYFLSAYYEFLRYGKAFLKKHATP